MLVKLKKIVVGVFPVNKGYMNCVFACFVVFALAVKKVSTAPIFLNRSNWNETRYDKKAKIKLMDLLKI